MKNVCEIDFILPGYYGGKSILLFPRGPGSEVIYFGCKPTTTRSCSGSSAAVPLRSILLESRPQTKQLHFKNTIIHTDKLLEKDFTESSLCSGEKNWLGLKSASLVVRRNIIKPYFSFKQGKRKKIFKLI